MVVITIWLPATKYPFLKWQWIFYFLRDVSFLYHCQDFCRAWLYIWVARWVSYKTQELLTLREHFISPPLFFRVASFSFLVLSYYVSLRSDFRMICVCLRTVVSNTYCVVFLFCFYLSCVPYVASFSGLSFSITLSVFSDTRIFEYWCCFCAHWSVDIADDITSSTHYWNGLNFFLFLLSFWHMYLLFP